MLPGTMVRSCMIHKYYGYLPGPGRQAWSDGGGLGHSCRIGAGVVRVGWGGV